MFTGNPGVWAVSTPGWLRWMRHRGGDPGGVLGPPPWRAKLLLAFMHRASVAVFQRLPLQQVRAPRLSCRRRRKHARGTPVRVGNLPMNSECVHTKKLAGLRHTGARRPGRRDPVHGSWEGLADLSRSIRAQGKLIFPPGCRFPFLQLIHFHPVMSQPKSKPYTQALLKQI